MAGLFSRLFSTAPPPQSKDEAKQRLKLLLIHDQVDLTPAQMEQMKTEILQVIQRYCQVDDPRDVEVKLNREQTTVVLHSTVPVRRVTARLPEGPATPQPQVPTAEVEYVPEHQGDYDADWAPT